MLQDVEELIDVPQHVSRLLIIRHLELELELSGHRGGLAAMADDGNTCELEHWWKGKGHIRRWEVESAVPGSRDPGETRVRGGVLHYNATSVITGR